MIQAILILLIFSGAAFYLGRMIYQAFQAKSVCSSGCGKCAVADFDKVQKALDKKA